MRSKPLLAKLYLGLAAMLVAVASLTAPDPAAAFGWDRKSPPGGWGETRVIHRYVYYPRYRHIYHSNPHTDPYAYRYKKPRYYHYHGSHYWVPAKYMKHRYRHKHTHGQKFRYHAAWGYSRCRYHRHGHRYLCKRYYKHHRKRH